MREERFPWGLGAVLVLAIVGGIGFWLGSSSATPVIVPVSAPVAPAPVAPVPAPVTPIYPAYAPHGGGFPLFPLFFGLIFLVVIFKFIRHAAWSGYQRGGPWSGSGPGAPGAPYGPRGFGGPGSRGRHHRGDVPPMVDEMFKRWHSRMHAEPSSETKTEQDASVSRSVEDEGGSLDIAPDAPRTDPAI